MAAIDWSAEPSQLGQQDAFGYRPEALRTLHVLAGATRFGEQEITDPRLRAVAAAGASLRELGAKLTEDRLVQAIPRELGRRGLAGFVARLLEEAPPVSGRRARR